MHYTLKEFKELLELTGFPVDFGDNKDQKSHHIIFDISGDDNKYADNLIHFYNHEITVNFYVPMSKKRDKYAIDEFMRKNFNTTMTTSYDSDKNWYNVIYIVYARITDL